MIAYAFVHVVDQLIAHAIVHLDGMIVDNESSFLLSDSICICSSIDYGY